MTSGVVRVRVWPDSWFALITTNGGERQCGPEGDDGDEEVTMGGGGDDEEQGKKMYHGLFTPCGL